MTALADRGLDALGQRRDLALRPAGRDHHLVGDAGLALEVDDDDVLCLAVVEGLLDAFEEAWGGTRLRAGRRFRARYGRHLVVVARVFRARRAVAELASRRIRKNAQAGSSVSARRRALRARLLARLKRSAA